MEKAAIFCSVNREPIHRTARKEMNRTAAITRIDVVCPIIGLGFLMRVFCMIRYVWLNVVHTMFDDNRSTKQETWVVLIHRRYDQAPVRT